MNLLKTSQVSTVPRFSVYGVSAAVPRTTLLFAVEAAVFLPVAISSSVPIHTPSSFSLRDLMNSRKVWLSATAYPSAGLATSGVTLVQPSVTHQGCMVQVASILSEGDSAVLFINYKGFCPHVSLQARLGNQIS